ncbi:MAG TPA: hypothetical protein VFN48_07090 [Solirubrobacteraceae bacterium]|nr:hypothetical protein [Solirubrobacteraceae bacterium]
MAVPRPPESRRRPRRTTLILSVALLVLVALGAVVARSPAAGQRTQAAARRTQRAAQRTHGAAQRSRPRPRTAATTNHAVTVTLGAPGRRVPPHFLGISLEPAEIVAWSQRAAALAPLLRALAPQGALPLRVGGESADSAFPGGFRPHANPYLQGNTFVLTPAWWQDLRRLADRLDARVTFDVNLAAHSPGLVAAEVRQAAAALGRRLVAVEIGNEPDLYSDGFVGDDHFRRGTAGEPQWAFRFTTADYTDLVDADVRAVHSVRPGLTILGPGTMARNGGWISDLLAQPASVRINRVSVHAYAPYYSCRPTGSPLHPTVAGYTSQWAATAPDHGVAHDVALAAAANVPLEVTEAGSAVCGGLAGVTTSATTALWAPVFSLGLLSLGAARLDVHLRSALLNSAIVTTPDGVQTEPLYRGLVLLARVLTGARTLIATRGAPPRCHVWAVALAGGGVRVLAVNDAAVGRRLRIRLSGARHVRTVSVAADSTALTEVPGPRRTLRGR